MTALRYLQAALFSFAFTGVIAAQTFELACPPLPSRASSLYALRDGWRCEGEFPTIKLSDTQLYRVAGLVQGPPFAVPPSGPLVIAWPPIQGTTGSLHAFPLIDQEKPVWQMDGRIDLARGAVTWPADFARRHSSAKYPLGLFATATVRIGDRERRVLLPVRAANASVSGSALRFAIWSSARLTGAWITIRPLDAGGRTMASPEGWTESNVAPTGLAFRQALWVLLPPLAKGFHELELAVESASKSESTLYYFYSPGQGRNP